MVVTYDFDSKVDRRNTGSLKWDKYAGKDILPFWVADMDFKSAPEIIEALQARVAHGVYGYTKPYASVIEAVCDYLGREHGVQATEDTLLWLPGLVPALNVAARAFGGEQASVLTCTPVYPPFLSAPPNQQRSVITVPLVRESGRWTFDFAAMEAALRPDTAMFILCNPHNPVGRAFSESELVALADFCVKHDLILCSDEIHCDLILDEGVEHVALARLDHPVREQMISLFAPSKTYNLPGLACSFVHVDSPKVKAQFQRAARGTITEVNALGYAGCEAAYRYGEPWRQALLKVLCGNRDRLYAALVPYADRVGMHPMEATYLAWMDMRSLGLRDLAGHFEAAGIGLSDGAAFGSPGFLRLNFGCPPGELERGLERLISGIESA